MAYSGIDGLRAYRVMMSLIYSLTQIREVYIRYVKETGIKKSSDVSFESFLRWFDELSDDRKKQLFKWAILCGAELSNDELLSVLRYRADNNGVAFDKSNVGNISIKQMVESVADICAELCKEQVFF